MEETWLVFLSRRVPNPELSLYLELLEFVIQGPYQLSLHRIHDAILIGLRDKSVGISAREIFKYSKLERGDLP